VHRRYRHKKIQTYLSGFGNEVERNLVVGRHSGVQSKENGRNHSPRRDKDGTNLADSEGFGQGSGEAPNWDEEHQKKTKLCKEKNSVGGKGKRKCSPFSLPEKRTGTRKRKSPPTGGWETPPIDERRCWVWDTLKKGKDGRSKKGKRGGAPAQRFKKTNTYRQRD